MDNGIIGSIGGINGSIGGIIGSIGGIITQLKLHIGSSDQLKFRGHGTFWHLKPQMACKYPNTSIS
jgi:hypothetical protein